MNSAYPNRSPRSAAVSERPAAAGRIGNRFARWLRVGIGLLLVACSATAQTITNLLSTGTFESGTLAGWNNTGSTSVTNGESHGGAQSARFTSQRMEAIVATTPGVEYKVTGWVRIVSTTSNAADCGGLRIEAQKYSWAHSDCRAQP